MRSWKGAAMAGVCLVAAACGGDNGETARADLDDETIGGEAVATSDIDRGWDTGAAEDAYGVDPALRGEVATGAGGEYGEYGEDYGAGVGVTGSVDEEGLRAGAAGTTPGGEQWSEGGDIGAPGSAQQPGMQQPGMQQPGMAQAPGTSGSMQEPGMQEPGMQQPGMAQQPGMGEEPAMAQANVCPADIEGLNVRVSTIPRGGALVFTTRGDENVTELRDRLNRFADMHRRHHEQMQGATAGATTGTAGEAGTQAGAQAGAGMEHGAGMHGEMGAQASAEGEQFADPSALIHQASEIRVVEIPRGARLEVRLDDSTMVRDLRTELREDASMLREGRCPLALQVETT